MGNIKFKSTAYTGVLEINAPSFPPAKILREIHVQEIDHVCHVCLSSAGTAWISDSSGALIQINKEGERLHKVAACRSDWGSFTAHLEEGGGVLYADHSDKAIYKVVANDPRISVLVHTGDWTPVAVSSSRTNGEILAGLVKDKLCKITRYSNDGQRLHDIQKRRKWRNLYDCVTYITENNNGDICASDWIANSVVVVTRSGQYRFSYFGHHSQQTFSPAGICTDDRGHILVCNGIRGFGPNTSSVHLLDHDGHFLSLLIPPERCPLDPSALCIDDQHNVMLGGRHDSVLTVVQYLQIDDKNTEMNT